MRFITIEIVFLFYYKYILNYDYLFRLFLYFYSKYINIKMIGYVLTI